MLITVIQFILSLAQLHLCASFENIDMCMKVYAYTICVHVCKQESTYVQTDVLIPFIYICVHVHENIFMCMHAYMHLYK